MFWVVGEEETVEVVAVVAFWVDLVFVLLD